MRRILKSFIAGVVFLLIPETGIAKQWTLRECIDYALQNNISLQKNRLNKLSAQEDILQSKAANMDPIEAIRHE